MVEVIVIGAGPVGLLMAAELRRRGVSVEILEQRAAPGPGSRAIGVHPPVLAALEDSGLTAALLEHALRVPRGEARSQGRVLGTVRFDRLSTRFPFVATLPQAATEDVFAAAAPAPARGVSVTAIRPARASRAAAHCHCRQNGDEPSGGAARASGGACRRCPLTRSGVPPSRGAHISRPLPDGRRGRFGQQHGR